MTIDEAIKKYRKLSNSDRTCYPEEATQIAEWLEELKMYKSLAPRELVSQKQRNDRITEYHKGFNDGYNKAIDDFVEKATWEQIQYDCPLDVHDIEEIAKQLKTGAVDD